MKIFLHSNKKRWFDHFWKYKSLDNKTHLQFVIKHHYVENWETEKKEDYFATRWDEIFDFFCKYHYEEIYDEVYNIPYLVSVARQTFGVGNITATHRSLIYERGNND